MCSHDEIIELLRKITAEQDEKNLPSLVERLHRLLADEIANLTALIRSGIGP